MSEPPPPGSSARPRRPWISRLRRARCPRCEARTIQGRPSPFAGCAVWLTAGLIVAASPQSLAAAIAGGVGILLTALILLLPWRCRTCGRAVRSRPR
jgi:hypothetical protein